MTWLHDVSQSALAAAVLTLGVVILLELRSVLRLRHAVDSNLARVFEQLDLLRFENQQLMESQAQLQTGLQAAPVRAAVQPSPQGIGSTSAGAPAPGELVPVRSMTHPGNGAGNAYQNAAALAAGGVPAREIADRCGLAAGEARLLSSLAQARARRAEIVRNAGQPRTIADVPDLLA